MRARHADRESGNRNPQYPACAFHAPTPLGIYFLWSAMIFASEYVKSLPVYRSRPRGAAFVSCPVRKYWQRVARGLGVALTLGLVLSPAAGAEPTPSRKDAPVEVSVLTYNTHGLPAWVARDRPKIRFPIIGRLTNQYDVVFLQEDFAYHGLLKEQATHEIVACGNGPRSSLFRFASFICGSCNSGLTLLARFPRDRLIELDREPFHVCMGWFRFSKDCWVTKGFMRARLRLQNGAEVDFYNLHLDAGMSRRDRQTRKRQLRLLRKHIVEHSGERALIIGGDFNLQYNSADDFALMQGFMAGLGLRDSSIGYKGPADWKGDDYILYRSGGGVILEVIEAGVAEGFVLDGKPLSNHPAIVARFRVR